MKTQGALPYGVGQDWQVEEIEVGDPLPGEVTGQAGSLRAVPLGRPPRHRRHTRAALADPRWTRGRRRRRQGGAGCDPG